LDELKTHLNKYFVYLDEKTGSHVFVHVRFVYFGANGDKDLCKNVYYPEDIPSMNF